jgi:hypothetical protein
VRKVGREKGSIPWNKGLHDHPSLKGFRQKHAEETKAKISASRKGKALGNKNRLGIEPWNKGIPYFVHDAEWRKKVSEANSGKNHWNWQGGISGLNMKIRNSARHREWSKAVYARDKWTCQKCGFNDHHKIIAHHIVEFSKDASLRFDVSNGITLCRSCHMSLHKPKRYKSPKVQLT